MTRYLVSAAEMQELDRQTTEEVGSSARTLMETAGRAVAQAVGARLGKSRRVVVVCGTGNNGGDGFVAASTLLERGYAVQVFVSGARSKVRSTAGDALQTLEALGETDVHWMQTNGHLVALENALSGCSLVVDALIGTGFSGPVRGLAADVIALINNAGKTVIAVDMPSGVNADTGEIVGQAVRATHTVTFAFAKRGLLLFPGSEHTGLLEVADIGIPQTLAQKLPVRGSVIARDDIAALLPLRGPNTHKGTFGTLAVVAGSSVTPGAALLALCAALRGGTGLVRWGTDLQALHAAKTLWPEVMLTLRDDDPATFVQRLLDGASAVCIGPGYSTTPTRATELRALLKHTKVPMCLDADALNLLAEDSSLWNVVQSPVVVTPHPKEMARLLDTHVTHIQRDRVGHALKLATQRGCVVVLKGAGTVVAEPDGTYSVVKVGNPGLATGGTGDVLAGLLGGFLAQGLKPGSAARLAVLAHGLAGDFAKELMGETGMVASDVVQALGRVWVEAGR